MSVVKVRGQLRDGLWYRQDAPAGIHPAPYHAVTEAGGHHLLGGHPHLILELRHQLALQLLQLLGGQEALTRERHGAPVPQRQPRGLRVAGVEGVAVDALTHGRRERHEGLTDVAAQVVHVARAAKCFSLPVLAQFESAAGQSVLDGSYMTEHCGGAYRTEHTDITCITEHNDDTCTREHCDHVCMTSSFVAFTTVL